MAGLAIAQPGEIRPALDEAGRSRRHRKSMLPSQSITHGGDDHRPDQRHDGTSRQQQEERFALHDTSGPGDRRYVLFSFSAEK
jgi:hypothetical protein